MTPEQIGLRWLDEYQEKLLVVALEKAYAQEMSMKNPPTQWTMHADAIDKRYAEEVAQQQEKWAAQTRALNRQIADMQRPKYGWDWLRDQPQRMPNLNIADMTDEVLREIQHRLLQLQGAGMSQQEAARQLAPEDHNSITTLKTLQPIRAATGRVLEGNWQGQELNATQIVESVYGNRHFILKIGYMHDIGSIGTFRLQFIVMMPIDNNVAFNDVEVRAEAQRTADAFMHMLNMRRTPTPTYQPLPPPDQAIQPPLRELQGKQTRGLVFDDMYNAIQSNALDLIKQRNLK